MKSARNHSQARLPVVIMKTLADGADRLRGLEAEADASMMNRDVDERVLLRTVDGLIGQ